MKSVMLQSLRAAVCVLLLASGWQLARVAATEPELPPRLLGGVLVVAGLAALFALLFRRVRNEDRIALLEAELCREQNARSQADQALAEADLLLARLTARGPRRPGLQDQAVPQAQLGAQLAHIQAELAQIQQHSVLDPACAGRLERARTRLEQVARVVRGATRAAEPG